MFSQPVDRLHQAPGTHGLIQNWAVSTHRRDPARHPDELFHQLGVAGTATRVAPSFALAGILFRNRSAMLPRQ